MLARELMVGSLVFWIFNQLKRRRNAGRQACLLEAAGPVEEERPETHNECAQRREEEEEEAEKKWTDGGVEMKRIEMGGGEGRYKW
jgi:hypothetical protein